MVPIPKGEIVAIFGGYIMRVADELGLTTDHHDFATQIHEEYVIGPKYPNEIGPTDFINHSCEPNCGIKGQIFLVSMRDLFPEMRSPSIMQWCFLKRRACRTRASNADATPHIAAATYAPTLIGAFRNFRCDTTASFPCIYRSGLIDSEVLMTMSKQILHAYPGELRLKPSLKENLRTTNYVVRNIENWPYYNFEGPAEYIEGSLQRKI